MAEVSGLTTVDKFVRKLLFKKQVGNENYARFITFIADGLQQLNFHHLGAVKTSLLSVDTDTKVIDYPEDYVGFVSLSVADNSGKMWTFTRDNRIFVVDLES